jgi:hypothetical protein
MTERKYSLLQNITQGLPRSRQEDNIKMDLRETGCESVDSIHPTQDRVLWQVVVNTIINLQAHKR